MWFIFIVDLTFSISFCDLQPCRLQIHRVKTCKDIEMSTTPDRTRSMKWFEMYRNYGCNLMCCTLYYCILLCCTKVRLFGCSWTVCCLGAICFCSSKGTTCNHEAASRPPGWGFGSGQQCEWRRMTSCQAQMFSLSTDPVLRTCLAAAGMIL